MPFPNPNKHTRQQNNQRLPRNGVAGKEPRGTRADRQHRRGPARLDLAEGVFCSSAGVTEEVVVHVQKSQTLHMYAVLADQLG